MKRALDATGRGGAVDAGFMESNFVFRPFASEADARAALAGRKVKGYYVVPSDYIAKGVVDVYTPDTFNISGSEARGCVFESRAPAPVERPPRRADERARGQPAQGHTRGSA